MSKVLCIAGMHRSGTSLTANWLYENNLFLGDDFLGKASSNQKGHFEDMEFLNIHVSLLEHQKLHRSGLILPNGYKPNWDKKNQEIAKQLIKKRNKHHDQWGWKEPRSTLYLRAWKEVIPSMKVLAVYRDPKSVVNSLFLRLKRNKWYKTRNPIKKFNWYFDIDLNPQKWYQIFEHTYYLYNQEILYFKKLYPEDTILVNLDDMKKNSLQLISLLEQNFHLVLKKISLDSIFDPSLMTSRQKLNSTSIKLNSSLAIFEKLETNKHIL